MILFESGILKARHPGDRQRHYRQYNKVGTCRRESICEICAICGSLLFSTLENNVCEICVICGCYSLSILRIMSEYTISFSIKTG